MLEQAADTAGRLGAEGITREVARCRAALAAISGSRANQNPHILWQLGAALVAAI